jgi:hypothetical protein
MTKIPVQMKIFVRWGRRLHSNPKPLAICYEYRLSRLGNKVIGHMYLLKPAWAGVDQSRLRAKRLALAASQPF